MPGRLERLNQILTQVEQKGSAFMGTLARLNDSQVVPGKIEILGAREGRAYFRRQSNGLPIWSDLALIDTANGEKIFWFNLDFSEYNEEYTGLKARQLAATQDKLSLDESDALEALTLAVMTGDGPAAGALIERIARNFPKLPAIMDRLAGRGNSRLRSAFGRALALINTAASWKIVNAYLDKETAEGVRADIITATILNSRTNPDALPVNVLEEWLTGERLIDPLSCVLALTGLGLQLSPDIFELIQPQHQKALKAWFE
jgi:hypothetical protein